jgi:signal transduction histidine kinase
MSRRPSRHDDPATLAEHSAPARAFDALPASIGVLDGDGRIVAVNAAWRRFGEENGSTDPGFGVGRNYLEVCDAARDEGPEVAAVADGLRDVLAGARDTFEFEYPCVVPGETRWFALQAARWLGDGPARIVISHADVTARRQAEDALREADRRKDEFLALLAHELRHPLTPIVNATRVIQRSQALDDGGRSAVAMIARQADHLRRLVDDLLDVERISRGRIVVRPERIDLGEAARVAVETARPEAEAHGHRLTATLPAGRVEVDADPVRLAQILDNLLANACRYTPDGGDIAVRVVEFGEHVEVRVEDTGIGFDRRAMPRLFEPFQQLEPAGDRGAPGLGLGLALVRQLAELHGGTVRAESAGPGRGSTFALVLPRPPAG